MTDASAHFATLFLQRCSSISVHLLKKISISAVNEEYRTDQNISSVVGCSFGNIAIVIYANYANANLNISSP